jgi:hypothetical protein
MTIWDYLTPIERQAARCATERLRADRSASVAGQVAIFQARNRQLDKKALIDVAVSAIQAHRVREARRVAQPEAPPPPVVREIKNTKWG